MLEKSQPANYFFEVLKSNQQPSWSETEKSLIIGNKRLNLSYIQYWAYPKDSGKTHSDLPHAEVIASANQTPEPALLIDQLPEDEGGNLEIVLEKDGHAWAKGQSSLENLEDNVNSMIEYANERFSMKVEGFMTTDRVSAAVNQKLDQLEKKDFTNETNSQPAPGPSPTTQDIPKINSQLPISGIYGSSRGGSGSLSSKIWVAIPVLLLVLAFTIVALFGDEIISKFNTESVQPEITPAPLVEPTATPTPEVVIDRSKHSLRVLNGTLQSGAAGTLAETLKEKGWNVIKVGNAPKFDNPKTYIKVKKGLLDLENLLLKDLSGQYDATSAGGLDVSDKADAEVVIGQE